MAIIINGSTISTSSTIKFNDSSVSKVVYNGTQVWAKTTGSWQSIWSGQVYIEPNYDEVMNDLFQGINSGVGFVSEYITSGSISGAISADATLYNLLYDPNSNTVVDEQVGETLTKNNSSSNSNLPWQSSSYKSVLGAPYQSGSDIYMDAECGWSVFDSYVWINYYIVTNLYKWA